MIMIYLAVAANPSPQDRLSVAGRVGAGEGGRVLNRTPVVCCLDRGDDGHVVPVQDGALVIDVLDLHTILCLHRGKKSECRLLNTDIF